MGAGYALSCKKRSSFSKHKENIMWQSKAAAIVLGVSLAGGLSFLLGVELRAQEREATATDLAEIKAVERAALDYCEAFYDMKPELLERSLHPELVKFGFYRPSAKHDYKKVDSSYEHLHGLAKVWNKDGKFGPDAPKQVQVFEVLDKIAAAKVIGAWGIDYLHLAKYDGKWMITQVIWQSPPMDE
jgi:hypothetical protein